MLGFQDLLKSYIDEIITSSHRSDYQNLALIANILLTAKERGSTIFSAGNGGSASTASHLVNDLVKGCRTQNSVGFKAFCLNDSVPIITCLANDFSYSDIYRLQLETFAQEKDVFIVFSGSGNSENIFQGLKLAKELDMITIGFGGRDGGKMKQYCDVIAIAPTTNMEMIEDFHLMYEHALITVIREKLTEKR